MTARLSQPVRTGLIPVAAYYRMSDDKQENSIDRQKSQVIPYAARHGYEIIREYIDEGIAGDEEAKRKDFMRMLADAQQLRDFRVILCDDKDRFGRFDSITQGYYVKPLRDAGVRLESVAQGPVDWASFAGRITAAVLDEAKKLESQANSRRVITRMLMMARDGKWLGGDPPYGYDLADDPVLGKRLVPGDPEKVEAVRLMFRLYGVEGYTLDQLSEELFRRGIPAPPPRQRKTIPHPDGRRVWQKTTLRGILRNRKYVGDTLWNTGHDGKYSEFRDGLVSTSDQRTKRRTANDQGDWVVVPDTHEPLVSRELFEAVQARLAENKKRTSPTRPDQGAYLLSGLLVCGHCGWRMIGCSWGGKRYYKCGRYHQEGKRGCHSHIVREEPFLNAIARKLQADLRAPGRMGLLRERAREQAQAKGQAESAHVKRLRKRAADLAAQIDQGLERMALIDADLLADYAAKVRGWKQERERVLRELESASRSPGGPNVEGLLRDVEALATDLRDAFRRADPRKVRAVLQQMLVKVELWFDHRETARMVKSVFRKGVADLKRQPWDDLLADLGGAASPTPAASGA
jgi:DNA invertase Pin-like site-specific DNA recombinase